MKRIVLLISGVGLFVGALWLGWAFRAANTASIDLDLIWLQVPSVELWWLVLLATSAGALLAALVVGFVWLQERVLNRRYRKTIGRLESELHQMRSLPLSSGEPEDFAGEQGRVAEGRG